MDDPQTCVANGLTPQCKDPATGQVSMPQVDTFFIANPNLGSEQSDQYSIGFVWSPLGWLDMSLDYYNIQVQDTISSIGAQDIINMDLDPATYGQIPAGLSITRNPANGRITKIVAGYGNVGDLVTDGLDLRVGTNFDLGNAGNLRNQLTWSYVNKYEITDISGETIDFAGYMGTPDTRVNLQNTWTWGDFDVNWNVNYIDGQATPGGRSVGSYTTNDLQFGWNTPWNGKIVVGATNLGDRYPALEQYDGRPWNFYLYDAYGRTPYFRYTQSF